MNMRVILPVAEIVAAVSSNSAKKNAVNGRSVERSGSDSAR
jgi:hypothetical protein